MTSHLFVLNISSTDVQHYPYLNSSSFSVHKDTIEFITGICIKTNDQHEYGYWHFGAENYEIRVLTRTHLHYSIQYRYRYSIHFGQVL